MTMETTEILTRVQNSFSYKQYKDLVIEYAGRNATSGEEQLTERVAATKINAQRMIRIDKQVQISNELLELVEKLKIEWEWLVIAESWCGDGAQNIPIIAKIAASSPAISLKIILRDENPEIMDAYLTNGSRSIPKLICFNKETKREIGIWGPRPTGIQQKVKEYKMQNPNASHDEFVNNLHLWYAKDKGVSLQNEFKLLIAQWIQ
jgi:hypothetical protein